MIINLNLYSPIVGIKSTQNRYQRSSKKKLFFICCVNTWVRHRLYIYTTNVFIVQVLRAYVHKQKSLFTPTHTGIGDSSLPPFLPPSLPPSLMTKHTQVSFLVSYGSGEALENILGARQ